MNEEISLMEQVDVLRAACCVVAADGEVSDAEAVVIERIAKKAGVGGASRDAMIEMSLTSPKFLESQFRFLMHDPVRAMKVLLIVASADGMISESEKMLVTEFANRLKIDEARFQTLLRSAEQRADRVQSDGKATDGSE